MMIYLCYDNQARIEARNYKEAFLKYYVLRDSSMDMNNDSLWYVINSDDKEKRPLKEFFGATMNEIMEEMYVPAGLRRIFSYHYNMAKGFNFSSAATYNFTSIRNLFRIDVPATMKYSYMEAAIEDDFNLELLFILLAALEA